MIRISALGYESCLKRFDIPANGISRHERGWPFHLRSRESHGPVNVEGFPWERWILRNFSKMRVRARLSFIVTTNLPSFVTLIRCFIGRSKPLGRLEEFGQAVFHKEVKIQRSLGTPSKLKRLPVR